MHSSFNNKKYQSIKYRSLSISKFNTECNQYQSRKIINGSKPLLTKIVHRIGTYNIQCTSSKLILPCGGGEVMRTWSPPVKIQPQKNKIKILPSTTFVYLLDS